MHPRHLLIMLLMRWSYAAYVLITSEVSSAWTGAPRFEQVLFKRATAVREKIFTLRPEPNYASLAYPSAYAKPDGSGMRGFCNWLIPGRLMVGQYPGQNPEVNGPSADDVYNHIQSVVHDGVSLFCSLQSEIPPQSDVMAWESVDGKVYLPHSIREEFPRPFTHYAPVVKSVSIDREPAFLHSPIPDLNVPTAEPLQKLLLQLLQAMEEEERTIYLHCWGGRGRAGLVGSCLVSLIYPELEPSAVLDLVQSGYDTRAGAEAMPTELSRSPQTTSQRQFVQNFVLQQQRQRQKFER